MPCRVTLSFFSPSWNGLSGDKLLHQPLSELAQDVDQTIPVVHVIVAFAQQSTERKLHHIDNFNVYEPYAKWNARSDGEYGLLKLYIPFVAFSD